MDAEEAARESAQTAARSLVYSMQSLFPSLSPDLIFEKYISAEIQRAKNLNKSWKSDFFDIVHNTKDIKSFSQLDLFVTKHLSASALNMRMKKMYNEAFLLDKLVEKYEEKAEEQGDVGKSLKLLLLLLD